jgi:hypothetical protein
VAGRDAWIALPEQPRRYRLRDRWSDFLAGRRDAREGIPRVPPEVAAPAKVTVDTKLSPEDATVALPEDAAITRLVTPYLAGLRALRNEQLARELGRYETAHAQLHGEIYGVQARGKPLATDMEFAASQLKDASTPPTEQEVSRRGPAERDEQKWPPDMLRERREGRHRLARLEAEEILRTATARFHVADLEVEQARVVIEDHFKIAQAAGWQVAYYYARREAAYLRSLVRKHENGPAVMEMLELAGPQLPEWLMRTEAEKEGP